MRVLEAGDDLRLGLEPADEVGVVRQVRMDRLDGHVPAHLRLERAPDRPETPGADALEEAVAAERRPADLELGALPQDPLVEPSELRRRVDPELLGQELSGPLERGERVGLPARAVEREDQLPPQAFAERVVCGERLELADDLGVPAEREHGLRTVLDRGQAQLIEPGRLGKQRPLLAEVGERGTTPERERLVEGADRGLRFDGEEASRVAEQRLEVKGVHLRRVRAEHVAGAAALDALGAEGLAKVRRVALERVAGRLGRLLAPHLVDQDLGRDEVVRAQEQVGEDRPLLRAAERDRAVPLGDLQRPEDAELHGPTVSAVSLEGNPRIGPGLTVHAPQVSERALEERLEEPFSRLHASRTEAS